MIVYRSFLVQIINERLGLLVETLVHVRRSQIAAIRREVRVRLHPTDAVLRLIRARALLRLVLLAQLGIRHARVLQAGALQDHVGERVLGDVIDLIAGLLRGRSDQRRRMAIVRGGGVRATDARIRFTVDRRQIGVVAAVEGVDPQWPSEKKRAMEGVKGGEIGTAFRWTALRRWCVG